MCLIGFSKCFQLYDPGLVPYSPWDDLFGVFPVIRFDDGPAAMRAVVAAPFKVVKVARRMDFSDDGIAVACIVR